MATLTLGPLVFDVPNIPDRLPWPISAAGQDQTLSDGSSYFQRVGWTVGRFDLSGVCYQSDRNGTPLQVLRTMERLVREGGMQRLRYRDLYADVQVVAATPNVITSDRVEYTLTLHRGISGGLVPGPVGVSMSQQNARHTQNAQAAGPNTAAANKNVRGARPN